MSSLHDIQNHIDSVSMTRKITNAMYLLSTSRLKKDITIAPALREYMKEILQAMEYILSFTETHDIHHKFTELDSKGISLYLIISGDKSLCGDYNAAIARLAAEIRQKDPTCEFISYNLYGEEYLKRKHIPCEYSLDCSTIHFTEQQVRNLTNRLIEMYMTDYFNSISVISTPYGTGKNEPQCRRLLPLKASDYINCDITDNPQSMIFAPSADHLFEEIVPEYIMGILLNLILQASASENAARMEAMQSATDNADEMISELSTKLNAERQLGITNEITEIAASQL